MMEWASGEGETIEFYLPVARKELLKMLEKALEDPLICEMLRKTLVFERASLQLEQLREKYLKPTEDEYLELINLMKYAMAIRRKTLRVLLEIIKRSSENNQEDLITAYIIVNTALSEITKMLCDMILHKLDSADSSYALEVMSDSLEHR